MTKSECRSNYRNGYWLSPKRLPVPLFIFAYTLFALAGCQEKGPAAPEVTINGHTWQVEVASTPAQTERGLGGRASLPPDRGMFFVFDQAEVREFWMKDCLIDIDIAFIDSNMKVVKTYTMPAQKGAREYELTLYNSILPAQYALEVAGGVLAKSDVKEGDKVQVTGIQLPSAR